MVELSNIWFYTLSTSAQVLAAIVGIFAVFVVYKLQGLTSFIEDVRTATIKILPYIINNVRDYKCKYTVAELEVKSDRELIAIFKESLDLLKTNREGFGVITYSTKSGIFPEKYYDFNDNTFDFYNILIGKKEQILERLKESIALGLVLISTCIIELTFTKTFINFNVLFLTSLSIVFYFTSIAKNIYFISTK